MDTLKDVSFAITLARKNLVIENSTISTSEYEKELAEKLNASSPLSEYLENGKLLEKVELVAIGGYNEVWKFKPAFDLLRPASSNGSETRYIVRIPKPDSLIPYQLTNEVAYRTYIASRLPHIPVPTIYITNTSSTPYTVEQFINGTPLSDIWLTYSTSQKSVLASRLANIMLDLLERRFPMIGGLHPVNFSCAPPVEGCKIFKGRSKFHSKECYDIGPYKTTEEYVLAYYDKEIHYYENGTEEDLGDTFEDPEAKEEFIRKLKEERKTLEMWEARKEPFVLMHGDFHGRNILMTSECEVAAVLDWEFAGSYPLSEALTSGDFDVVEAISDELDEENTVWGYIIRQLIKEGARERGWNDEDVELLVGDGDMVVGVTRTEMSPDF